MFSSKMEAYGEFQAVIRANKSGCTFGFNGEIGSLQSNRLFKRAVDFAWSISTPERAIVLNEWLTNDSF